MGDVMDIFTRGLLQKLPSLDPAWSEEIQARWFRLFNRLLDMGRRAREQEGRMGEYSAAQLAEMQPLDGPRLDHIETLLNRCDDRLLDDPSGEPTMALASLAALRQRVAELTEAAQEAHKHLPYGGTRDWLGEVLGVRVADDDDE